MEIRGGFGADSRLLTFLALMGGFRRLIPCRSDDRWRNARRRRLYAWVPDGRVRVGALVSAVRLVLRTTVVGLGRLMTMAVAMFGVACVLLGISHWFWISML